MSTEKVTYTFFNMPLWTVIADYRGGTYISQVRAISAHQAIIVLSKSLPNLRGSFLGPRTKLKIVAAAYDEQEKPVPIEKTRNVWYWNRLNLRPAMVVHLIKTSEDR
jgi:hypothetical protein